ncbi:hypothetical protein OF83DRAFT_1170138 [Amylostereum chailletii]|nr:hypothetical protein OF83DRAFT_1170138 [Amylostereum chailletii]
MSRGLTEDQVALVRSSVTNITTLRVFPDVLETALFAMFTVLICFSTGILLSQGLRRCSTRVLLALTLFMYAASAVIWAANLKIMWNELNVLLPALLSPETQINDIESTLETLDGVWVFISDLFGQTNIILSDMIVLWRACVVWNRHKGVVSAAVFMSVCLIGVNIAYALADAAASISAAPKAVLRVSGEANVIAPLFYALSAIANVWATSMVEYKAWVHRRDIHRYLQNRTSKSAVETILVLLVESGIVYSILMVVLLIENLPSLPVILDGKFNTYWGTMMNHVSGTYPTLVIVIVALQKSHLEHQFSYAVKEQDVSLPFSAHIPQSPTSRGVAFSAARHSLQLVASESVSEPDGAGQNFETFASQEKVQLGVV